ncbi:hypothetical protein OAX78_02560 [Planctomycetota bacterium]|nr:hypothetical protein [Planctomycetota bacterium]
MHCTTRLAFVILCALGATGCPSGSDSGNTHNTPFPLQRPLASDPAPHLGPDIYVAFLEDALTSALAEELAGLEAQEVALAYETADDDSLEHLASIPTLRGLSLASCHGLSGDCLEHVAELAQLELLDLTDLPWLRDDHLSQLRGLHQLTTLSILVNPQLTGTGIEHLGALPALSTLEMEPMPADGAAALGQLSLVRSLKIHESANMGRPDIDDANLVEIGKLDSLEELELHSVGFLLASRRGLVALGGLTQLRTLVLTETEDMTSDDLRTLAGLTSLRDLHLLCLNMNAGYTTEDLVDLVEQLRSLRTLKISYYTGGGGLAARLRALRPDLRVEVSEDLID